MRANYEKSLSAVLKHEGGYVNHPADPGGATNKGITQKVYDAYRQRLGLGVRSVKLLADDEMRDIYKKQYWDVVRGDDLPDGVDFAVFDFGVNSGPSRAVKFLQMGLGVKVDGIPGVVTLRAAEESDPRIIINAICDKRLEFLKNLPHWETFKNGWRSRVAGVRAMALSMAADDNFKKPNTEIPQIDIPPPFPGERQSMAAIIISGLVAIAAAVVAWFYGVG
jgi:lysozyme family protein